MTRARIEDAFAFMAAGEVSQAVRLLQTLAAETPAHATVHVLLAQGYERLHRWPDALGAWQAAALLMPDALVVRQGALRATRVLAALRAMADDGALLAVGTPSGQRLMPVEVPQPLTGSRDAFDAPADPLATLSYTAGTPLGPPSVPVSSSPETTLPDVLPEAPPPAPPDGAVYVSPPLSARTYTPATPHAAAVDAAPSAAFGHDETGAPPSAPPLADAAQGEAEPLPVPDELAAFFDKAAADAPDRAASGSGGPRPRPAHRPARAVRPHPPARRPHRPPPPPLDLGDEEDDPVSETLARIYAGQRQFAQAARIYERLAEQQPEQADRFRAEADALRGRVTA